VHLGEIDIKETFERLFELVNLIAQAMISQLSAVQEMPQFLLVGTRQLHTGQVGVSGRASSNERFTSRVAWPPPGPP
jgi:hypothetical protein